MERRGAAARTPAIGDLPALPRGPAVRRDRGDPGNPAGVSAKPREPRPRHAACELRGREGDERMNRDRDRVERSLREPGPREERSGFVALPADIAEARAMLRHSERSRILRGFLGAGAAVATAAVAVLVALAVTQAPAPAANGVGS